MINSNGKSDPESMELKKVPYEEYKNDNNSHCVQNIIIFILIIGLCTLMVVSYRVYNQVKNNYEKKILEKDDEISKIQYELNELKNQAKVEQQKRQTEKEEKEEKKETEEKKEKEEIKEKEEKEGKKKSGIDREYEYDIKFYKENSMYSSANLDLNRLGYSIVLHTHTLEKGLEHFNLRPFGKRKVHIIMDLLKKELKFKNHETDFSFINGINSLREYKKTYEDHKWTDTKEYKDVSKFLKDYTKIPDQKTGAYILTKEELKKDYDIDYKKFIKSRHSTRNYKNLDLKIEDIKEAVEMAKYSASACNRQYIKLHYYPKGKMKQKVIDYSIGKGGLYLEGVNTFIITFDVNGLIQEGERNQGYFNAGLFATNLVNAFHSLGIGTCFIQFANSVKQEEALKKSNDIPSNERIAVILYAGYYDEKSIFAVSPRKSVDEIFTEHK